MSLQPVVASTPALLRVRMAVAFALPILIAGVIAGCGNQPSTGATGAVPPAANSAPAPAAQVHVTATARPSSLVPDPPDAAETTAYAVGITPQFIVNTTEPHKDKIAARYAFAAAHPDALAQMPCYCGCAIYMHQHTSLQNCYLRALQPDGKVVYTDHSLTCDICAGEVDMMMALLDNTPLKSIRDQIAKKYGYTGVWTDTPPIQ